MAEAEEARLGLVVDPDAVMVVVSEETTGETVAAALGAATVDGGTAREAVPTNTARRSPSARLRARAPPTARSRWWRARGVAGHGRGSIWTRSLHLPAAPADDALRSSRRWGGLHEVAQFWSVHRDAFLRLRSGVVGSACCSRSQSACEQRATESTNCNSATSPRASNFVGAVGVPPGVGGSRKRGAPTGSAWSQSDGIRTVGTGEAAGAGLAAVDGAGPAGPKAIVDSRGCIASCCCCTSTCPSG